MQLSTESPSTLDQTLIFIREFTIYCQNYYSRYPHHLHMFLTLILIKVFHMVMMRLCDSLTQRAAAYSRQLQMKKQQREKEMERCTVRKTSDVEMEDLTYLQRRSQKAHSEESEAEWRVVYEEVEVTECSVLEDEWASMDVVYQLQRLRI